MNRNNFFLFFILITQFLCTCSTSKDLYFSYKVEAYAVDSVKRLLSSSDLITFGSYLLEFRKRTNIESVQHGNGEITEEQIRYDTISVYLLSEKNRMYYEFDTFSLEGKMIESGKLAHKKYGVVFSDSSVTPADRVTYSPPVRATINNISCFSTEIISSNSKDSIKRKMILIRGGQFNSLYKINDIRFPDNKYCIVGIYMYNVKQKQGYSEEIKSIRPLTEKERNICEIMVEKTTRK